MPLGQVTALDAGGCAAKGQSHLIDVSMDVYTVCLPTDAETTLSFQSVSDSYPLLYYSASLDSRNFCTDSPLIWSSFEFGSA